MNIAAAYQPSPDDPPEVAKLKQEVRDSYGYRKNGAAHDQPPIGYAEWLDKPDIERSWWSWKPDQRLVGKLTNLVRDLEYATFKTRIRGGTNRAHCGAFCTGGCPADGECSEFGHPAGPDMPLEPIDHEPRDSANEGVMAG